MIFLVFTINMQRYLFRNCLDVENGGPSLADDAINEKYKLQIIDLLLKGVAWLARREMPQAQRAVKTAARNNQLN